MSALSPIPTGVRAAVNARSRLRCEWCGQFGRELHHRKGGTARRFKHQIPNLVRLCRRHHDLVTRFPRVGYDRGFSIYGNALPETVPVVVLGAIELLLTPAGNYLAGSQPLRDFGQVQDLLAAVRMQWVGPADSILGLQATVPAPGVVVDGFFGQPRAGLVDPVGSPGVERGPLVFSGEDVRQVLPYLSQSFKAHYRIGDVPEAAADFG